MKVRYIGKGIPNDIYEVLVEIGKYYLLIFRDTTYEALKENCEVVENSEPQMVSVKPQKRFEKPIKSIRIYVDYGTHENEEQITLEGLKALLDSIENSEV